MSLIDDLRRRVRDAAITLLGGTAPSHALGLALDLAAERNAHERTRKLASDKEHAQRAAFAELEARTATLEARLAADRAVGAEAFVALARSAGKVGLLGDENSIARLKRIAAEDGLGALAAELAEFPAAGGTNAQEN
jgi:hypothetical protein